MRLTDFAAAAMGSVVALAGFANAADASATIDLIWADTGTSEIRDVDSSSQITLQVILTAGRNITSTTTFNSAYLIDPIPEPCNIAIEINALRGGSPTVSVGETKDITAKARIPKGTAVRGTTFDTTLQIDAIDGSDFIDSQSSGPIRLEVGKGGHGDTLAMNIDQCSSGIIQFRATFFGTYRGARCGATRTIAKTCK